MKKNEIKGLSAARLLDGLDDDMILSASLPEATPVPTPTVGEKIEAFFGRMGKGGMAAAVTGIVVAAAVLIGILLAGHFPVWEEPGIETEPGPVQSRPNIDSGILYPPLTETPDNPQKNALSVVSDGITVYPKGYCVYLSEMRRDENGELTGVDADGMGAVYQLAEIWDELPILRTAGDSYELNLPKDNMTLRSVRIFELIDPQNGDIREIALPAGAEGAADVLKSVTSRKGEYVVVLEIYYETIYSADEYTKGLDEYAFRLVVDPSMNHNAPVRVIHGDKTYFPTGYLLEESYYDAELGQEITKQYDGAEKILAELATDMVTVTVARGESLGLYLAPFYELKWVRVFDSSLRRLYEMGYDSPLDTFSETEEAGDYYVIITAAFLGTGETSVTEFPIHIKIVEERESTPAGDVGETPEPPRLTVSTGFGSLHFGNTSHSSEYHEGYMLWTEQWYDGGMISGDGFGAEGQLADILGELPTVEHYSGESVSGHVIAENDSVIGLKVCTPEGERIVVKSVSNVLDLLSAMNSLTSVEEGTYVVILTVVTQGDYIPEAEAYERTCTEYAFVLKVVEEQAGIPGVPETNPRVVVSGGGQTAVFATEEDGFFAWREVDLSHIQGTPAASVIFTDDDALRALPDMEIFYSDRLTVTLDAAGDDLLGVILYDAKGELIAKSNSLSVVDSLENDGWDRGVILVLQIISSVSETERVCYEYAIDLTIRVPAPPSGEPVDVMIGSEFILPYSIQISAWEWTGSEFDGWTAMIEHLSSFTNEIPAAEYTETTRVRVSSDHVLKRFEIWDADFNLIRNETLDEYTALDDLHAALNQLSPGTYYLTLKVVKYGQYIESHHLREEWETNYYVALRVS